MPENVVSRTNTLDLTSPGQHCLLLGAKGAGMSALTEILRDLGHHITGLDHSLATSGPNLFRESNVRLLPWNDSGDDNFDAATIDVCIASPAVARHPLLNRLRESGVPVLSLHEAVALAFRDAQQICVAGTHGKSTTSAMLAWILDVAGRTPGFFVGAQQPGFQRSGRSCEPTTDDKLSVLESCEFARSFQHFTPTTIVLTGIERDHFDCFPDQASEDAAFIQFLSRLPSNGHVILNADCQRSRTAAEIAGRKTSAFRLDDRTKRSQTAAVRWIAGGIREDKRSTTFSLRDTTRVAARGTREVELRVPGRHNVANAVGAIAAAVEFGVSFETATNAVSTFPGIRRRFEQRGQYLGVTLIDDYAHHPTAILATLEAARNAYPGKRIIVAFEPHQLVRTTTLFPEFVAALGNADEVLLLPVFPAREQASHQHCCRASGTLVKALNRAGTRAFLFANLDQVASRLDHSGRPTDILLTMGAGRTNLIHDQLIERLQRNSVA